MADHGSTINRAATGGSKGQVYLDGYGWVQPIRDMSGQILYYADPITGQRINRPMAGPGTGQMHATAAEAQKAVADREKKQAAVGPEAPLGKDQLRLWVDGKYVTVQQSADGGTWTVVGDKGAQPMLRPSAFDALDGQQIEASSPFLMGYKLGGDPTKSTTIGNLFDKLQTGNRNVMTIAGGVQWLAGLATKDPEAYQSMLDKLHNANYLSDSDYASAAGHWSAAAGNAFALAARDVAVVNTTPNGADTTLDQFLAGKQGALDAAKQGAKQPYQPVNRAYTDPEDLKASARSTAEKVLGRQLTDAEEKRLTDHFHSLETAKYDTIDAAHQSGKNASYTAPGSGQIDAFVEGAGHEQEAANFRAAGYGQTLMQMFGVG